MENNTFSYSYSAKENQEVLSIRQKYLPREESKLDELKRLDRLVQTSGTAEALTLGTLGCLIFGAGLCLVMEVIGSLPWLGIPVGLVGAVVMALAYPAYRLRFSRAKAQYAPRILELTDELSA